MLFRSALEAMPAAGEPWEVFEDGSIGVGGCVVDTANGEIDARLDVQLETIARVLRQAVPHGA